jgi:hypothetical protein
LLQTCLIIFSLLVSGEPWAGTADSRTQLSLDGIKVGEGLKRFKRRYQGLHCRRRAVGAIERAEVQRQWIEWIDCALDRALLRTEALSAMSSRGDSSGKMSATFQNERLVSLEYVVGTEALSAVVHSFSMRYGPPDKSTLSDDGQQTHAVWIRGDSKLEIEQIVLCCRIDERGFVRVEKQSITMAVRIRLTAAVQEGSGNLVVPSFRVSSLFHGSVSSCATVLPNDSSAFPLCRGSRSSPSKLLKRLIGLYE